MILRHNVLSCFNMSPYRTMRTHFSPNTMIVINWKSKTIESESFMKLSICKTKLGDVLIRVIYPGADGGYQMKHPVNQTLLDMKAELIWATPVVGVCYNPPLRGATKAE